MVGGGGMLKILGWRGMASSSTSIAARRAPSKEVDARWGTFLWLRMSWTTNLRRPEGYRWPTKGAAAVDSQSSAEWTALAIRLKLSPGSVLSEKVTLAR